MSRSLYFLKAPELDGLHFGVAPVGVAQGENLDALNRRINFKELEWDEKKIQSIICKGAIWVDFPARGYSLVTSEIKAGDEDQRVDLLYLRTDGALLPCELKVGGKSFDSHGQLIRYIADLHFQDIDRAWLCKKHSEFTNKIKDDSARKLHQSTFERFLSDNKLQDRLIRVLPRTGIIIDEDFKPPMLKAVRYLNGYCGFAIRMIGIEAFVAEDWEPKAKEFRMRVDLVDIN